MILNTGNDRNTINDTTILDAMRLKKNEYPNGFRALDVRLVYSEFTGEPEFGLQPIRRSLARLTEAGLVEKREGRHHVT